MNIQVRTVCSEDAADSSDSLAHIMISAWCSGFRGILKDSIIEQYTYFPDVKAMFTHILASNIGTMYLAQLNGQPAGLLYLLAEETNARIEALLTCPEVWGKGVGAALLERALADIKAAGYPIVHLWPFVKNHRARRFYEKHGFRPSEQSRMGDAAEMEYIRFL